MNVLYFDCIAGISGDMALAALVDAGADPRYIESELAKLDLPPYTIQWERRNKNGISALKADMLMDTNGTPANRDHHNHNLHAHYADIVDKISRAGFSERVTARSLAIFEAIGKAEGKIHGIPLEKVHFHEVGAVDSIVDTVGVALALESLDIAAIYCSAVPLGYGTVVCAHGTYPVPAPATLELMRGKPIEPLAIRKELTTPTGAGIVSALADGFSPGLPAMTVAAIGYGAGSRDLEQRPNVLRAIVGTLAASGEPSSHVAHTHGHSHHRHDHAHSHTQHIVSHTPDQHANHHHNSEHEHSHNQHPSEQVDGD